VDNDHLVLVVEAEAPLRRSLEKFLFRAGYACQSCGNAREALALAKSAHPEIVIAAYRLPDANGLSLADELKRNLPGVAVIVLSEVDYHVAAKADSRANIRYFLRKPFDLSELEAALQSARPRRTSSGNGVALERRTTKFNRYARLF
jgi:DNA-binding response OmpR family regulator